MAIIATKSDESDFEPVPQGTQGARCISVIDIGTQHDPNYDKWKRQVIISWEVPSHTYESEEGPMPMTISKFYTLSMGTKANLYKDVCGWLGRSLSDHEVVAFDVSKLLGTECLLNVIHVNEKHRVQGVMSVPQGMVIPPAKHPLTEYNMDEDPGGQKAQDLPEWIQKFISRSRERCQVEGTGGFAERPEPPATGTLGRRGNTVETPEQKSAAAYSVDDKDDIPFSPLTSKL